MTRGGFQTHSIPDLMGYVAIVTGDVEPGNSGIGFETALQLALRHARVYIASRSAVRAENAIAKMRKSAEKAFVLDLSYLSLDLQDLQSVKQAAKDFMQRESRLDLLISNAGIMAVPFELTVDGYEKQWQTNYLSHHALFVSLLPLMRATAATSTDKNRVRVVLVSSSAGVSMGPKVMNYDDPNMKAMEGATGPWFVDAPNRKLFRAT
ncbi:hypothetical protein MMC13_004283 [Lambiella insularis]|nr:hypothetical protein [Lambiella insularis]